MSEPGQRARFCNACNAVVGWYAIHCDLCGNRIDAEPADPSPSSANVAQMVRSSESDLFTSQMRLLHRFAEESSRLQKGVSRHARRVRKAAERALKRLGVVVGAGAR